MKKSTLKKLSKLLTIIGILVPLVGTAQINKDISNSFPAHIVYKINEIDSKAHLTKKQQLKIATELFNQDSLANLSLRNGANLLEIKEYFNDEKILKANLSDTQMDFYLYEMNKSNRFLTALKFADDLNINKSQCGKIRSYNLDLDITPQLTKIEKMTFCNNKLKEILSNEQYVKLLQIVYKEQTIEDTKTDWTRIEKLGIATTKNKEIERNQIMNYHLVKNGILDTDGTKYDKKSVEALHNKIAQLEPPILIRANILSAGNFKDNLYSSIIKYEKEIKISSTQIDTILNKYMQLESIRFENEQRDLTSKLPLKEPLQFESIPEILTTDQINIWLSNKNKNQSLKIALKNWKKLEMEGLTKNLNKEIVVKEFTDYQLKQLIADDKVKIYNTQEFIFAKRDIEQKKPLLLKQLDNIAKNKSKGMTTKNALTW